MPYGYLGTTPNQQLNNSGVFSVEEALALQNVGEFGGSLKHISTTSFSGVTDFSITSGIGNTYDTYYLVIRDLVGSTAPQNINIQFYESGVLESASVYQYAQYYNQEDGGTGVEQNTSADRISLMNFNSNDYANGYMYLYNFNDSSKYSSINWQNTMSYDSDYEHRVGGGYLPQTSTVDGIKFILNSGTMTGKVELYGVKDI